MIYEQASDTIIQMAKALVDQASAIRSDWRYAYYRFRFIDGETDANASYVVESEGELIGAMRFSDFFERMDRHGSRLFQQLEQDRGIALLCVDSDLDYDMKFEFEDMDRWRITKLDGGLGIPEGL